MAASLIKSLVKANGVADPLAEEVGRARVELRALGRLVGHGLSYVNAGGKFDSVKAVHLELILQHQLSEFHV